MQSIMFQWPVQWGWVWAVMIVGCQAIAPGHLPQEDSTRVSHNDPTTNSNRECALTLVQTCANDAGFFQDTLGWSTDSTALVLALRNGADGVCGTRDDGALWTLEPVETALADTPSAVERLLDYALEHGCENIDGETIANDVPFSDSDTLQTVRLINIAGFNALTEQVALSPAAARAIIQARPFSLEVPAAGLMKLVATDYVGTITLHRLREAARQAFRDSEPCQESAVTVSTVSFTVDETFDTLNWTNQGSQEQLSLAMGPIVSGWVVDARTRVSTLPTLYALDLIEGINPAVLEAIKQVVTTQWCPAAETLCGCNPKDTHSNWPQEVMDRAELQLDANSHPIFQRFRQLLGEAGYARLKTVFLQEIQDVLSNRPKPPTPLSENDWDALVSTLLTPLPSQARFVRPFEIIDTTPPVPDNVSIARQVVSDALIQLLGDTSLEETDIGVSFDELIAGHSEILYLDDIQRWRSGESNDPVLMPLDHAWIFSGTLLGVPTSGTVSRTTGQVLSVELECDGL